MTLPGEIRYGIRALYRSPVFFAVSVLTLALGIGANTSVFTMVDQVLVRTLPVQEPDRLVQLTGVGDHYGSNTGMNSLSYPMYKDFSEQNQVFSGMLSRARTGFSISYGGHTELAAGEVVSGSYFPVLGLKPAAGRLLTSEDDRVRGGAPVAVLSYEYWQTRFAGDPTIVGKDLLVNNHKLTVVGIAPRDFDGVEVLFATQIYTPISMAKELGVESKPFDDRRRRWVQVFARLKPGVSITEAKAAMQPVFHRLLDMEVQQPEFAHASAHVRKRFLEMSLNVAPGGGGQNVVKQFLQEPLWAMMAMVGLVLLIACANVANLMIARATSRQKEIAVRLAIGAGRMRIVRQLLVESSIIAVAGGLLGLALMPLIMRFLAGFFPQMEPPLKLVMTPNWHAMWFTILVSAATALIFGLAPAVQATKADLAPTLKEQAGAVIGGGHSIWRKVLVAAQVSLSLLLLIGAGLFIRSLQNIARTSPGFEVANMLSFQVAPTLNGYKPEQAKLFYRQLTDKLNTTPGVQSAGLSVVPLLAFNDWDNTVTVEGYQPKPGEDMDPYVNYVSPEFFRTLKIPLYGGREFTDKDAVGTPKVAIVNEKFARAFFGDQSPIGRHLGIGGDPGTKTDIEIVGVVRNTKYSRMRDEPPRQVFFPYQQNTWAGQMTAYVRTNLNSEEMFPVLRSVVSQLDPNLPLFQVKTEEHQREDSLSVERFAAGLATAFGTLATVLAAIGLYGVMAFVVARRTREIGIRMALGALTGDVLWLVMREVIVLVGSGIVVGLPLALVVTRLLSTQLYSIAPHDPVTLVGASMIILAIAAISGYLPAWRATNVDPLKALHYE